MEITIRAPVYPTEDETKVLESLSYFWMTDSVNKIEQDNRTWLSLSSNNRDLLFSLKQAIHDYRIIDAVRRRLLANWSGTLSMLILDKQAAYSGKLKIVDDAEINPPLGGIEIVLNFEDDGEFEDFLDWFTPRTVDGEIIDS